MNKTRGEAPEENEMSEQSSVTSLDAVRARREREAYERGEAFAFHAYEYQEDAVGYIDGALPLSILLEPEEGRGIAMTRESAERLRDELTAALDSPHAPWNGGGAVG